MSNFNSVVSLHRSLVFVGTVMAVVANVFTNPGSKRPNGFGGKGVAMSIFHSVSCLSGWNHDKLPKVVVSKFTGASIHFLDMRAMQQTESDEVKSLQATCETLVKMAHFHERVTCRLAT